MKNRALLFAIACVFLITISASYATDVVDTKPTKLSQEDISSASVTVDKYIAKNGKLPNSVIISDYEFSMPEFMNLLAKTVEYKYEKNNSQVTVKYDVKNPIKPSGNNIKGKISAAGCKDYAKRTANFISNEGTAPNYVRTPLGNIQYQQIILSFIKILGETKNKEAPKSISLNFNKNGNINKYIPKYTRPSPPVQAIQLSSSVEITTYNWGTGGDVTKNNLIKNNIPKSQITDEIIKAAKKGTPVVKFGGGNGPITLVVSGVHGGELSSQVAAMNLINDLNKLEKEKRIKGTIYVIPFVAPKSTAANSRLLDGRNLNSIANKAGTPTNNIIKFAKDKKIDAVGDFHCTRPGGVPGKNIILGTKNPTSGSAEMAIGISKLTGHPYKNENQAAKSYPGALEDNLNLNGIPSVTCEVKTPHGKIAPGSVSASYNQMKAFLKYNKNI